MSANDVTLPFKQLQDRYYSLDMPMQQRPPPMCSPSAARAYAKSLGTLFLGIFIGYLMFAGPVRLRDTSAGQCRRPASWSFDIGLVDSSAN